MRMELKDHKITRVVSDRNKKKYWVVNSKGKRISLKCSLKDIEICGPYIIISCKKGKFIYHEKQDDLVFWDATLRGCFTKFSDNLYEVMWPDIGGKPYGYFYRLYNANGERLLLHYEDSKPLSNGLIAFMVNGKWGYLDEYGNVALKPLWATARSFNSYGFAIVRFRETDKMSVIDKKGIYMLAPSEYSDLEFLSEEFIQARKDSKEGVITIKGTIIVPLEFDAVTMVDEFFKVRRGSKYGLYDKNGTEIFECIYPEIIETPDKLVVQDFARQEVVKQKDVAKSN